MMRFIIHVVPHGTIWAVKRAGVAIPLRAFYNKQDAINYAIMLAKHNTPSQVIIHRRDGMIEDERTYVEDPYPPRG